MSRLRSLLHPAPTTAAATFIALTLLAAWPLLAKFGTALPSDLGDPVLVTWIFWWNANAWPLTEAWWNAPMFHPMPGAFALAESLLGVAPLTTPLLWLGLSPIVVANIAFLLAWPLMGMGGYALGFALTRNRQAAMLAGLLLAFSPYRIAQLSHLQILLAFWMPLALAVLHEYLRTSQTKWLVVFGVAWLLNGLTCGYFLFFFPVLLGSWMLWFVPQRRQFLAIAVTSIVATLPMLPLLLGYAARQKAMLLSRTIGEAQFFSADLTSLVATSPRAWLSSLFTTRAGGPEGELYPGLVLAGLTIAALVILWRTSRVVTSFATWRKVSLALAGVAAALAVAVAITGGWNLDLGPLHWSAHRPSRLVTAAFWFAVFAACGSRRLRAARAERSPLAFYLIAAAVMLLLAMGPSPEAFGLTVIYKGPYSWLMQLPGGMSMRVPARFAVLMLIALAGAAAVVWTRLKATQTMAIAAMVAILAEGWIVFPIAAVPPAPPVPALAANVAVLELPAVEGWPGDALALLRSEAHGHPIVHGFSGYDPPHYPALKSGLIANDLSVLTPLLTYAPIAVFVDAAKDKGRISRTALEAFPGAQLIETVVEGIWILLPHTARPTSSTDATINATPLTATVAGAKNFAGGDGDMFDGTVDTRWRTPGPQQAGAELLLDFGEVVAVNRLEMDLGEWSNQFPRGLEVRLGNTRESMSTIWKGRVEAQTVMGALESPSRLPIGIAITGEPTGRLLLLTNLGADREHPWSITEFRAFGRRLTPAR